MKFNTKLTTLAAAISLTTLLVACGGGSGGTDTAGIGGSGFTSSGTITGFGSVFVNGVKFETTNATFDIEGIPGTQNDLAIGMVVQVNGIRNPDGITGTATSIVFDDNLQGPVANFTLAPDALTATFTVLGINVEIDSKTTYFDPDNSGISITRIANGNMVELSGFFDGTGTLIATRIENKTGIEEEVELKGNIANLSELTFTLQNINISSGVSLNGLKNGDRVEVKGTYDLATNTITATEIESEEIEYGDSDEYEVEGYITDFISRSDFKVGGIPVDATNAKFEPSNTLPDNDLQVEVEGRFFNGILIAEEVKMRGGDVEISAPIISIDTANNRFTVEPANGQTL
ncbi:MAG: DUF5666 domain-containing protein, partial [Thiomicrorhabdus sp.]|nr:DUF5666 domain-containing protein [Thiomicrorhabdus sp.]